MFRFSRDNWLSAVRYDQFMAAGRELIGMAQAAYPNLVIKALTQGQQQPKKSAHQVFNQVSDNVVRLETDFECSFDALTRKLWDQFQEVKLSITEPEEEFDEVNPPKSMLILLSRDDARTNKLQFYGANVTAELAERIFMRFGRPSLGISIGQGTPQERYAA